MDAAPYPNLAAVPDKPPPVTPEQIRASTAAGLEADRANAQYTAPLTAAGTSVQSAAPPSASAPSGDQAAIPATAGTAAVAGAPTSVAQETTAVAAAGVPSSGTQTRVTGTTVAVPSTSGTATQAATTQAATTTAAAATVATAGAAAATGGRPSASQTPGARALAASRQQGGTAAPQPVAAQPVTVPARTATAVATPAVTTPARTTTAALPPLPPRPGAQPTGALPQTLLPPQGTVGGGNVQLVAVIYFANGSDRLDGRDVSVLREVAAIQRQYGGILRVVGHASARTATLPQERHQLVNLNISFDRAESVGQSLQRAGVPAGALVLEGVSDRQPVYHEFMPTGEAGNRRAEIFLEY
ncbi:MAG: hypothetical protein Kilf2KO_09060 [Rhodospirillales bacterium]